MKHCCFLLLLILCASACKADLDVIAPIGGEDTPYFSVTYRPDSTAQKTVVAGVDNVYLYTDFKIGSDDVITSTATFTQVQCLADNCPGRLRFEFRNTQLGSVVLADSAFHPGYHSFKVNDPPSGAKVYHVVFQADTTVGFTSFLWTFDNTFFMEGSQAPVNFPGNADSVLVKLQASRMNGPTSTVQRWVSLSGSTAYPGVDILISPQGNDFQLSALPTGIFTSLLWNNGQTQPVFTDNPLHSNYMITAGSLSGHAAEAGFTALPANLTTIMHTANFSTSVSLQPLDPRQRGTVALQWTDPEGHIWRSDRGPQLPGSRFQVVEGKAYELNELGQYTWQMQVAFICYLYNDSGQRRPFSGTGQIAAAYPGY